MIVRCMASLQKTCVLKSLASCGLPPHQLGILVSA